MDFAFSPRGAELREQLLAFMDECVLPAELTYHNQLIAGAGCGELGRHEHRAEHRP